MRMLFRCRAPLFLFLACNFLPLALAVNCPPGQYSNDTIHCYNCSANTYCQAGIVTNCPPNSISPPGSSSINDCGCPGNATIVPPNEPTGQCICNSGFLKSASGTQCTLCPANHYCPDEFTQTACSNNALSAPGQSSPLSCNACPAGYVQNSLTSSPISCRPCTPGYACPNVTTELPCPPGSHGSTSTVQTGVCTACPANTYAPAVSPACTPCDPHATAPPQSSSVSACICNNGTYWKAQTSQCLTCLAGFSCVNIQTNTPAVACTTGTYATLGSSACTQCLQGTYQDTTQASACKTCPAGTIIHETLYGTDPYLSINSVIRRARIAATTVANPLYISLMPINHVGYNITSWAFYASGSGCAVTPMLFSGTQSSATGQFSFTWITSGTQRVTTGAGLFTYPFSDTNAPYLVPPQIALSGTTPATATYLGWQFAGPPCIYYDIPSTDTTDGSNIFYYVSPAISATASFLEMGNLVTSPAWNSNANDLNNNNQIWSVAALTSQTLNRYSTNANGSTSIQQCQCPDGTHQLPSGYCQDVCPNGQYINSSNPKSQSCIPCAQGSYCMNSIIAPCPVNMGSLPGAVACSPCINPGQSTDIQLFTCGMLPTCSSIQNTTCCTWNTPIQIGTTGWYGLGTIIVGVGSTNGVLATPWSTGDTILGLQLNPASDRPLALIQSTVDLTSLNLAGTQIALQFYYRCTAANKCPDWLAVFYSPDGVNFNTVLNITDFTSSALAWVQIATSFFDVSTAGGIPTPNSGPSTDTNIIVRVTTQMALSSSTVWIGNFEIVDLGNWKYDTINSLQLLATSTVLVPWFTSVTAWQESVPATFMTISNDRLYLDLSAFGFYSIPANAAPYAYAAGVWINGTGNLVLQTSAVDYTKCTAPTPAKAGAPGQQVWCQLITTTTPTTFTMNVSGSLTIINPSLTLRRNILGCQLCLPNYWCNQMSITACVGNSVSPAGSNSPTQCTCSPGYYGSPGTINPVTNMLDTCKPCQMGYYCPGGPQQIVCPNGTITLNTTMSKCTICSPDWYCAFGTRYGCPPNSDSPSDSHDVTQCICNPGYYGIAPNCKACEPGFYCINGTKTACVANAISPPLSSDPSACYCNPGWAGINDNTCQPCTSASYCMHGNTYACPSNMWSPTYSSILGNCTCDYGYYPVQQACSACSAGSYKDVRGPGTCTSCTAGKFSIGTAASSSASCVSCSPGKYLATAGQYQCQDCAAGSYSSATGSTFCAQCWAGSYSNTGASMCTVCNNGTYSNTVAATSISTCQSCPSGAWSFADSTECTLCGACAFWHYPPAITFFPGQLSVVFSSNTMQHYSFALSSFDGTMYMAMNSGLYSANLNTGTYVGPLNLQTPDTRPWWFASLSTSVMGNYLYAVQDSYVFRIDIEMGAYDIIYSSKLATCVVEDSTQPQVVLWIVQPTMVRQVDPVAAVDINDFSVSGAVYACVSPTDPVHLYVTGSFGLKTLNKNTGVFTTVRSGTAYGMCQITPDGNFIILAQTSVKNVVVYSLFSGGTPTNLVANAPVSGLYVDGSNIVFGIDLSGIKNFSYRIADSRMCSPGEFAENGNLPGPEACEVCPVGNLCPSGPNVTSCAAGTYGNQTGMREQKQCIICPEGSYCQGGECAQQNIYCTIDPETGICYGPDCEADPVNGYGIKTCPTGSYSPYPGLKTSTDCPLCYANFYCPNPLTLVPCPNNTYSNEGSSDLSDCTCAPGYRCIITKVVHAQVVLQMSASTFASSPTLQQQYINAIATAAGVSPSLVSIQGYFTVNNPSSRRRMLSYRRNKTPWNNAAVDVHTLIRIEELTDLHDLNLHLAKQGLPPHLGVRVSLHHEVVQSYRH